MCNFDTQNMKAETTARLFHAAISIAIFAVLLAPVASALLGMGNAEGEIEISTGAEYDVQEMDAECLALNISEAVQELQGCVITYGEYSDPVDSANALQVAKKVIESGAVKARVFDSDGKLASQKAVRYSDAVSVRTVMDVHLPEAIASISDASAHLRFSGSDISIPAISSTRENGSILRLDFTVPYVIAYAAFSLGCGTTLELDLNYGASVKMSAEIESEPAAEKFAFSTYGVDTDIISGISKQTGIPVLSFIGIAPDSAGKMGIYADYEMSGGVLKIDGRNDPPSASLAKSLEKNGEITISSGNVSTVIPKDSSEGLIKALKTLETMNGGFRWASTARPEGLSAQLGRLFCTP